MERRGILEIGKEIHNLLSKEKELSAHAIAKKVKCEWRTAIKVLEFMVSIKSVKERKISTGEKRYERLFGLVR